MSTLVLGFRSSFNPFSATIITQLRSICLIAIMTSTDASSPKSQDVHFPPFTITISKSQRDRLQTRVSALQGERVRTAPSHTHASDCLGLTPYLEALSPPGRERPTNATACTCKFLSAYSTNHFCRSGQSTSHRFQISARRYRPKPDPADAGRPHSKTPEGLADGRTDRCTERGLRND